MSELEPVTEPGNGILPALMTFVVPLFGVIILGEGVIHVLSLFISRREHREEWNIMVAKNFSDHIVVCGVGELGKALVKRISTDYPGTRIVLVDTHPGILTETGLPAENIVCIQSDMTNIETLKKANCHRAKLVLLASGNDAFNMEAAYKILQLNPNTEIWVRLHHAGLADLMDLSANRNCISSALISRLRIRSSRIFGELVNDKYTDPSLKFLEHMMNTPKTDQDLIITGDITMDWNLARTRRSRNDITFWSANDTACTTWQHGGSALLADLLEAVAGDLQKSGSPSVSIRQTGAPRTSSEVQPDNEQYHHSYAMWSPWKYGTHSKLEKEKQPWRVEEFLGLDRADSDIVQDWQKVVYDSPKASLVVLDDANLGFRDHPELWPTALNTKGEARPWILLKMACPLKEILTGLFSCHIEVPERGCQGWEFEPSPRPPKRFSRVSFRVHWKSFS